MGLQIGLTTVCSLDKLRFLPTKEVSKSGSYVSALGFLDKKN
jgi:hypothetical protein